MTSAPAAGRPRLQALALGDACERWSALGFLVAAGGCWVGETWLALGQAGHGIVGWCWAGLLPAVPRRLDGLPGPLSAPTPPRHGPAGSNPNGALSVDHVVVLTGDFDRTAGALSSAGLTLRRVREAPRPAGPDAGPRRQGFYRVGEALLELVELPGHRGPPWLWGLGICVEDLDGLAARLGERLGRVRPAVQPGRRIATLRAAAGLDPAIAFISPKPVV